FALPVLPTHAFHETYALLIKCNFSLLETRNQLGRKVRPLICTICGAIAPRLVHFGIHHNLVDTKLPKTSISTPERPLQDAYFASAKPSL
ncbi:hypothetical protein, partial [Paraburkholderia sp. UYCP14C]|uniref:hypothetical protein n=1 Tax=Paraburkholderia sp. UYCP14C TaxID=2511130 RepID=UPI001B7D568C